MKHPWNGSFVCISVTISESRLIEST